MYGGCHHQTNCVFVLVDILLILSTHNTSKKYRDVNNGQGKI